MRPVLLIDFGSTYTKVTAVDVDEEKLLGTAASFTTIFTDINEGLQNAVKLLEEKTGKLDFAERYACSSAAGGLRMVTSGLVPELTAEAAKMASLGAGAKIMKVYSFNMTEDDAEEIEKIKPDIMLLVGGTDGGNSACILNNAHVVSTIKGGFPVIIAGNRNAARQCERIIGDSHKCYVVENVMPKMGTLNIEPTQSKIRDIFLERIITAKGLTKATSLVSGIVNPTPASVLKAIRLLAEGTEDEPGIGELLAVDVGGATTDVYTICDGRPTKGNAVFKGLPEPYAKRTVEGDIGMRYSINGIVEAAGIRKISELSGIDEEKAQQMVDHLAEHTDEVPTSEEWERLDYALASMAIDTAVERHAGHLEEIYTVMGSTYMQTGKDLSNIRQVVVTGGSLIHTKRTDEIAAHALYNPDKPMSLRPGRANILVDRHYILASMGLLSEHSPTAALHIMKKELENMGEQIADASAAAVPGSGFVPVMDFADCHSGHHPED